MRTSPLLANFIHARGCKPKCEKSLTRPEAYGFGFVFYVQLSLAAQPAKPRKSEGGKTSFRLILYRLLIFLFFPRLSLSNSPPADSGKAVGLHRCGSGDTPRQRATARSLSAGYTSIPGGAEEGYPLPRRKHNLSPPWSAAPPGFRKKPLGPELWWSLAVPA